MIRAQSLSFAFGKDLVLQGLSLDLMPGSLSVLAGANGSGKSTLLSLLAGIYRPRQGVIEWDGVRSPGGEKELRRRTGLLLQEAELQILGSTVEEDLCLGLKPGSAEADQAREMARFLGLSEKWKAPVQQLSGGQKRKLCLAGVLLRQPRLLLFDEPFSGLDYPAVKELRAILDRQKAQGLTQVIATHDLEPVVDLADELLLLHEGRLAAKGRPGEVLDRTAHYGIRPPCLWQVGRDLSRAVW
jgi:biotin transport system ATP-binding protein